MRVLVVTNFEPDPGAPHRGRWVEDQVKALRDLDVEVELLSFPPGKDQYLPAARRIRRALSGSDFDLVHAHYGLVGMSAWLAGAKPLVVTFHGTDVRHPQVGRISRFLAGRIALAAPVSGSLLEPEGGRAGLGRPDCQVAVLPCGPDLERFRPGDRGAARSELGLEPDRRYLFFPADPRRPEKRVELARAVAERTGATLLEGGGIAPELMPIWMQAADAVIVTSLYEGFGLACLEALACERPVLSTPVGVAPLALAGLGGTLCSEFDLEAWSGFAEKAFDARSGGIEGGRRSAARFGAERMAERVLVAYRELLRPED